MPGGASGSARSRKIRSWRKRVGGCLGGVLVVSALSLAALSTVAGGVSGHAAARVRQSVTRIIRKVPYARFTAKASNGYKILVSSTFGEFGAVRLIAFRKSMATEYSTFDGHADGSEIVAGFRGLGHISVKFHPSSPGPRPFSAASPTCHAVGKSRNMRGTFRGYIYFRGEGGFTKLRIRQARGDAGVTRLRCGGPPPLGPVGKGPEVVASIPGGEFRVGSDAFDVVRGVSSPDLLGTLQLTPAARKTVPYLAEIREDRRLTSIERIATADGSKESLAVSESGQRAVIQPPSPFTGKANLAMCPREDWSGNLAVQFPGKTMRLTRKGNRHRAFVLAPNAEGCGKSD